MLKGFVLSVRVAAPNVKGQASDTEGGNPPQDAAPSVPPNPDLQRVSDCLHRLDRRGD